MRAREAGFTLIEVVVVLGIFAVIGLIGAQIVSRVLENNQLLSERGARLAEVQRSMQILQRDLLQLAGRGVRDQLGDPMEPLMIGADGMIEFTRFGWRNPLERPRSQLQRVGYIVQDDTLFRAYWMVLDRAPDSEPQLQKLLSGVTQAEFFALDRAGNEYSFWPPAGDFRNDPNLQLAAVILRIDAPPFGVVERIWPVPNPDATVTVGVPGGPGANPGTNPGQPADGPQTGDDLPVDAGAEV
ncbi:MAG: type II secretion system minor pseudopilin GspJ [Pseudomonadota bacterium]